MTNRPRITATLVAMAALGVAVPAVLANEIYKWTDADGVVHFGDRPGGPHAERVVHIQSDRTVRSSVPARTQGRADADGAPEEEGQAAQPAPLTEAEQRAAEQERAEKCEMYKARLQTFLTSRRLYREDENGERVYLDEEETLAARAKVQEQVVEFCD